MQGKLEPIRAIEPDEPDRAQVERSAIHAAQSNSEKLLAQYRAMPDSSNGRYVSADLMKEVFQDYGKSRQARGRYNNVVHNSAAVLASAQYRVAVADRHNLDRDEAYFITGVPGAGKTSAVMAAGIPERARVLYEGQLVDKSSHEKIAAAVDEGLDVKIFAVMAKLETALENTQHRFNNIGRGAAIATMARIHEKTPDGLLAIHERFGDLVHIEIIDNRDARNRHSLNYADGVRLWRKENEIGPAAERLYAHLDAMRRDGRTTEDFERQAKGETIRLRQGPDRSDEQAVGGSRGAGSDRKAGILSGSEELADKFARSSQKERLADPRLNSAAKALAIANAHIDTAHTPGSPENRKARALIVEKMAGQIAKGRRFEAPTADRTADKGKVEDKSREKTRER